MENLVSIPTEWYLTTYGAFTDLWKGLFVFLPKFFGALLIFLVGWIFASAVGRLVKEILKKLKFNELLKKAGWSEAFKKADLEVDASEFLGAIVKWVLVIVVLLASVEILGFLQFAVFLTKILSFVPNVLVSVLMLMVAAVLADIFEKIVVAAIEKANVSSSRAIGLLSKWAIMVFAVLAVLVQLGIAREMILTLFTGIIALLVISFGLAFGLGGKDIASEILRDLKSKLK